MQAAHESEGKSQIKHSSFECRNSNIEDSFVPITNAIGLPVDLLIGYAGKSALIEIKRDAKARKTPLQQEFFDKWTGGTLARVDSVEAALRLLEVMDKGLS